MTDNKVAKVKGTYSIVGKAVPRLDARDKLTGKALYAGDFSYPGMLHLKVLRSDRAHAKILQIRTDEAKKLPGVAAVFTYKDIPGANRIGAPQNDRPVLCDDKVRFVGDAVALVAAETRETALQALSRIEVEYEELPALFSVDDALSPDAIKIHAGGNLLATKRLIKGNVEQGLKESAAVISRTYRTPLIEHAYLEPEAAVALYEGGKLTVHMPAKYAHADRRELAAVLGLRPEDLRIVSAAIGGYFGDKVSLSPGYYTALAALKTGRPAKMVYSRRESFFASSKRHPFRICHTTGATREGKLLAAKIEILADAGAYAASSTSVITKSFVHAAGPYEIPNVEVTVKAVYTNNPVCASMRGLGVPQVAAAHESQMDLLAESLRIDPFDLRLKNAMKPGSITATGQRLNDSVGLAETIVRVREEILRRGTPRSTVSKKYGWGVGSMFYGIGQSGMQSPSQAWIEADDSGKFVVYAGCVDAGQGAATALAQIAAEELNCGLDKVYMVLGDTDLCPDSGVTAASRVTYIVGGSVLIACRALVKKLQEAAAEIFEISSVDLRFENGFFHPVDVPQRKIATAEVVEKLKREGRQPRAEGLFSPEITPLNPETGHGNPMATYAFATQAALVSVDVHSGQVEVLDMIACHDVGKAINPAAVAGQIEGAISMGIGFGLMEEVKLQNGVIQNANLSQYYMPTSLDMPDISASYAESAEASGPFGAKGLGEPALVPTAPAILNAISAAAGVRPQEMPVTPEVLWSLLKKQQTGKQ